MVLRIVVDILVRISSVILGGLVFVGCEISGFEVFLLSSD